MKFVISIMTLTNLTISHQLHKVHIFLRQCRGNFLHDFCIERIKRLKKIGNVGELVGWSLLENGRY